MKLVIFGGTGSFGRAMLTKVLHTYDEIVVFSRDEKKQYDMQNDPRFNDHRIKYIIGDVRNYESVKKALQNTHHVFAAAAMKQVPICEEFPFEAVQTNILGNWNILNACEECQVQKAVFLSTDKAVMPINAMGATKMLMEKMVLAKAKNSMCTQYVIVRYGNVAGSRGSVIPLFLHQIKNNMSITLTDKRMTRFVMTLDDAIDLVLHGLSVRGNNGFIYVKKSPKINIYDMIMYIYDYFSKPFNDTNIKIIGNRNSEKIHETLVTLEELQHAVETKSFFEIWPVFNKNIVYNTAYDASYTSENAETISKERFFEILHAVQSLQEDI